MKLTRAGRTSCPSVKSHSVGPSFLKNLKREAKASHRVGDHEREQALVDLRRGLLGKRARRVK